jgi:tetratricopeptide (TPR) repeat protein
MGNKNTFNPLQSKYFSIAGFALIFLTGIIAYWNSFQVPFQFDDYGYPIIKNKPISNLSDLFDIIIFYPARAICQVSFALHLTLAPENLFLFHLVNWLIHIGNAFGVYILLTHLLNRYSNAPQNTSQPARYMTALLCSLIFVCHPIHTQAVTYICQRYTSLATLFFISSSYCYLRYTELRYSDKTNASALLLTAAGLGLMANHTKETAAPLPLIWLSIEWVLAGTRPSHFIKLKWPFFIMFVLLCLPFLLLLWGNNPSTMDSEYVKTPSRLHYLLTQVVVIAFYFRLFFLPMNQNLDYDIAIQTTITDPYFMVCLLIHGVLFYLAFYFRTHRRLFTFGILFYYIALLPESSLMPLPDLIFEHRLYLPGLGLLIIIASLFSSLLSAIDERQEASSPRLILVLGLTSICWITSLTIAAQLRNEVWQTRESLWLDVVKKSPQKLRPRLQLGAVYIDMKQYQNAREQFDMAVKTGPWFSGGYNNLGIALMHLGSIEEAIENFDHAISIEGHNPVYWRNLGHAYQMKKEFDLAEDILWECMDRFPDYAPCKSRFEKVMVEKNHKE